jgi:hypothetical protein
MLGRTGGGKGKGLSMISGMMGSAKSVLKGLNKPGAGESGSGGSGSGAGGAAGEPEPDASAEDSGEYRIGGGTTREVVTLLYSWGLFMAVLLVCWDSSITGATKRLTQVADSVAPGRPCPRVYLLAINAYALVRTVLLTVLSLLVIYFVAQMANVMGEYMPNELTPFLKGPVRWLTCTDYMFRAVDPTNFLFHGAVIAAALLSIMPYALVCVSDSDTQDGDALESQWLRAVFIMPVLMALAYGLYFVYLIIYTVG